MTLRLDNDFTIIRSASASDTAEAMMVLGQVVRQAYLKFDCAFHLRSQHSPVKLLGGGAACGGSCECLSVTNALRTNVGLEDGEHGVM